MESLLGFIEPSADETVEGNSLALKLVPWISWDEWNSIRDSLFSSSPQSVAFALQRVTSNTKTFFFLPSDKTEWILIIFLDIRYRPGGAEDAFLSQWMLQLQL